MILGIGSDIIDIRRIERTLERYGEREHCGEQEHCGSTCSLSNTYRGNG